MATIEAALVATITADPAVAALIGTRFFPMGGRQGAALPYATFQRISTQGAGHLDGASNLDWPRFQIDVWAEKAMDAVSVAELIRLVIDSKNSTGAGRTFHATLQDQRGPVADADTRNFGVSQDYFIWHERT